MVKYCLSIEEIFLNSDRIAILVLDRWEIDRWYRWSLYSPDRTFWSDRN